MEFYFTIEQKVLEPWHEKIDLIDAALVSFISKLSPNDPVVESWMHKGMYRLSLKWILAEMPLLRVGREPISTDWISRRMKHLQDVGLVKLMTIVNQKTGRFELYGKLTPAFYKAMRKASGSAVPVNPEAVPEAENPDKKPPTNESTGLQSHGTQDHSPADRTPIDHRKDDHKRTDAPPPLVGAAAPSNSDCPRPGYVIATEEEVARLVSALPWKKPGREPPGESSPPELEIF